MNGSFERRRENVFRESYDAAAETQRESKAQREGRKVTSFRALVLCSKYDVIP